VANTLEALGNGRPIALIDQFAWHGNELLTGYAILSKSGNELGLVHTGLPEASAYDPSLDLRGRRRSEELAAECQRLVEAIAKHSQRCSMVLQADPVMTDQAARDQLAEWARELEPALRRLGEVFFPPQMLDAFREKEVEHVV